MRSLAVSLAVVMAAGASTASAAVVSQGSFRMGADSLWGAGIDGSGQTVAILDEGFGGLDQAIAQGELPPRDQMTVVSLDPINGLDGRNDLGMTTQHGTRMAEIVHDVAPGARLVLVNYSGVEGFVRAADWVAQRGIPIVSHSKSFLDGPFDGTGPAAKAVDSAASQGVLWVNSAGNFAQRYWHGTAPGAGTTVGFTVGPAGATLALHLSWDRPLARAEMVVEKQQPDGAWAPRFTATPSGPQSVEVRPPGADAGNWRVRVRQTAGPLTTLRLFSRTVSLDNPGADGTGSIATPSDARGAVSVAAVPWTGEKVAPYSSRGPTADGRAAPTIAAPTYVLANPAWPGTAGTSAAAAHAAGAAALIRAERQARGLPVTRDAVRDDMVTRARDIETRGPDMTSGAGLVRVDTTPPRLSLRFVHNRTRLRVRAFDAGVLDYIEVRVANQRAVRVRRAERMVGFARVRPGLHTVRIRARDMSGNESRRTLRVRVGRR